MVNSIASSRASCPEFGQTHRMPRIHQQSRRASRGMAGNTLQAEEFRQFQYLTVPVRRGPHRRASGYPGRRPVPPVANLAKAVERCVAEHRACLDEPDPGPPACPAPVSAQEPAPVARPDPTGKYADRARRHHAIVHGPLAEGRGLREIPTTCAGPAHRVALRARRHLAGTSRRPLAGTAAQQARPVQALPGPARRREPRQHRQTVQGDHRARLRRQLPRRPRLPRPAPPRQDAAPAGPAHRSGRHRLDRPPPGLPDRGRADRLKAILERYPELHAASGQVRAFAAMLTQLTGQDLSQWISDARTAGLSGISSFARAWNRTSTPSPKA
jgi:hypothetical protein